MVSEDAQGVENGRLLSTSRSGSRHEYTSIFTGETTGCPKTTGRIPERFPLSRVVGVSGRNTEEESVIGGEDIWGDDWVVWLGRSVHHFQDIC